MSLKVNYKVKTSIIFDQYYCLKIYSSVYDSNSTNHNLQFTKSNCTLYTSLKSLRCLITPYKILESMDKVCLLKSNPQEI